MRCIVDGNTHSQIQVNIIHYVQSRIAQGDQRLSKYMIVRSPWYYTKHTGTHLSIAVLFWRLWRDVRQGGCLYSTIYFILWKMGHSQRHWWVALILPPLDIHSENQPALICLEGILEKPPTQLLCKQTHSTLDRTTKTSCNTRWGAGECIILNCKLNGVNIRGKLARGGAGAA